MSIPTGLLEQLEAADSAHEISLILKSPDAAAYKSHFQIVTDHKKPLKFFKFKDIKRTTLSQLKRPQADSYYFIEIDHWKVLDINTFKLRFQDINATLALLSKKLTIEETDDNYDPGHTLTQLLDGLQAKVIAPHTDAVSLEGPIEPKRLSFPGLKSLKLNHVSYMSGNELHIPNLSHLTVRETSQSVLDSFDLAELVSLDIIIRDEATEEYEPTNQLIGDVKYQLQDKSFDNLVWGNLRNVSKLQGLKFPKAQNLLILAVQDRQTPVISDIIAPELTELTIEFNSNFPIIEKFNSPSLNAIRMSSIFIEREKNHTITLNEKSLEQFKHVTHWELYSGAKLASLINDFVEELNLTILTEEDETALLDTEFEALDKLNLDFASGSGTISIGAAKNVRDLSITFPEGKCTVSIDTKFPSVEKLIINELSSKSIKALKPIKLMKLHTLDLNNTIHDTDDLSILQKLITPRLTNLNIEVDPSESGYFELKSKSPLKSIQFRNISEFPQELILSSIPTLETLKIRGFHSIELSKVSNLRSLISEKESVIGSIIADNLSNLEYLEYESLGDDVEEINKINPHVVRNIFKTDVERDIDVEDGFGNSSGFSNSKSYTINMDDIEEEY